MHELDLITDLRPDAPLPGDEQLAPARARLLAATSAAAAAPHPRAPLARTRPRRVALGALAVSAVAACTALALVLAVAPSSTRPTRPTAALTAAHWLTAAASVTRHQAFDTPRPGQFIYTETVGPLVGTGTSRSWRSVDGSQPGLEEPAGMLPGPLPACTVAAAEAAQSAGGCALEAAYLPQLPADPSSMLAYLTEAGVAFDAPAPLTAVVLGKDLSGVLTEEDLTPAQRAGVFQLMASTPGFSLVPVAVDALGRTGVGLAWHTPGAAMMLVFDPTTYQYFGEDLQGPAGTWQPLEALATMQVVDALPPHAPFDASTPRSADH